MKYRKPYKVEVHIHLEKEKTSLSREVAVAVISAIAGALITATRLSRRGERPQRLIYYNIERRRRQ